MIDHIKIYTTASEKFNKSDLDPFGFDAMAERISDDFLPFSGTVRKPAYFLFVNYVNFLLHEKLIPWKTQSERARIKTRLEKLLVYCWKSNTESLAREYVIGSRMRLDEIEPFSPTGWRKQDCFKIYTIVNFFPRAFERYYAVVGRLQAPLLAEFIDNEHLLKKHQPEYLLRLRKSLSTKCSLFRDYRLSPQLKRIARQELMTRMDKKNAFYFSIVEPFFHQWNERRFWKATIENPRLPFSSLNAWFEAFTRAVDVEVTTGQRSPSLWAKAAERFADLAQHPAIADEIAQISERPNNENWFVFHNNRYQFLQRSSFVQTQWESYKKRQSENETSSYFFTYRHWALRQLILELS